MESFVACLSMQKVEERWQDGYTTARTSVSSRSGQKPECNK